VNTPPDIHALSVGVVHVKTMSGLIVSIPFTVTTISLIESHPSDDLNVPVSDHS
jgi:hypothetical protein